MLFITVEGIETNVVCIEDGELIVSEVVISAREQEPYFDEDGQLGYGCRGYKRLYIAAMVNSGNTEYIVSDYDFFADELVEEFNIYERYSDAEGYRMSVFEPFITIASDCLEGYCRDYYSIPGSLEGMGIDCSDCVGCTFLEGTGDMD